MADYYVVKDDSITRRGDQVRTDIDDLVSRAKSGDQNAFSLLYQEFVHSIYKYIYVRVNNQPEQAEDLTQEVFLKALNNLDRYRFRGKPFSSWLFRIAHNLIIDYYRKTSNNNHHTVALNDSTVFLSEENPVKSAELSMEMSELKQAIEKLPAQQKEVISLRFGNGLSLAETADAIGKTKGTVKKLQHVALVKLKKLMKR